MQITNFKDMYIAELQELVSMEGQLADELPRMAEVLGRCDKPRIAKVVAVQHSEHHLGFIHKRLHGLVDMRSWVRTMVLQD